MATVDRPTRAATRMSVATLASRGSASCASGRSRRCSAPRSWATRTRRRARSPTSCSNCSRRARSPRCSCRPSSTCSNRGEDREAENLASGPPRARARGDGRRLRHRAHRGAADRPAALHRRARPSARAATDRAVDVLPLLVHPAGAVLRVGHGRHRDPLRQAPLRDHRDRAGREHGVRRRVVAAVPRGRRCTTRASTSRSKRS